MEWDRRDIEAFLGVLDPEDNQTGGGTASAVAGAMAAGLAGMVARLSIGRKGMEPEEVYREIDAEARALTVELLRGGREDAEAFGAVMDAFRLPKETEEEKAGRSAAIQEAMEWATRVPLANAERCNRVAAIIRRLEGRSNPNAASDLACGRSLAATALAGCLANIETNLGSIRDESVRAEIAGAAQRLKEAAGLAVADAGREGGDDA